MRRRQSTIAFFLVFPIFLLIFGAHGGVVHMNETNAKSSTIGDSDGAVKKNRLAHEKSPYLLQHAENPVDWYPWGEEAFKRAATQDKPIFLSIGYSSCHWCHVMEEESFESEEVASILNRSFVSIKVDREERPDIDNVYMKICQSMTGSGGWPLTIIMTPDKKPFFAGTYFPRNARFGRTGIVEVLHKIEHVWKNDREQVLKIGQQAAEFLSAYESKQQQGALKPDVLDEAYEWFREGYDRSHGGFGTAPKFPTPHQLSLLIRLWYRGGHKDALRMTEETLDSMRRGGIFDHLGFGFHRYSTDAKWLVPHFEKMLYDQAMLAIAYAEAYQATGNERHARVFDEVFAYVSRKLTSPEGGFFSAEDADSEGDEGKFYAWSKREILGILGVETGDLFCRYYGITGNEHFEGGSVLHTEVTLEEFAATEKMDAEELEAVLREARETLFDVREKRVHPFLDDKILTDWNGLMIAGLARGAAALGQSEPANAARRAADFILQTMRPGDGRLLHRYRGGEAAIPGYIDDYAFLVWGLIELYEATFDARFLEEALSLTDAMLELFWDEKNGGFYFTGRDEEAVLSRIKEIYDGAVPSGNSIAAYNLLRLGKIAMRRDLEEKADVLFRTFAGVVERHPSGFSQFLAAFDFALGPGREVIIVGDPESDETKQMLEAVRGRFMPNGVVILKAIGEEAAALERIVPFVENMIMIDGRTTVYVCENYSCNFPVTEVGDLMKLLE